MLGLMALIGVTFATFAGQSLIASRNFKPGRGPAPGRGVDGLRPGAAHQRHQQPGLGDPRPQPAPRHVRQRLGLPGDQPDGRTGAGGLRRPAIVGLYPERRQPVAPTCRRRCHHGARSSQNANGPSPTPFYNQIQFATNIPDHRPVLRARLHPMDRQNPGRLGGPVRPVHQQQHPLQWQRGADLRDPRGRRSGLTNGRPLPPVHPQPTT